MVRRLDRSLGETNGLLKELDRLINARFPIHPFETGLNRENFEPAIAEYLAMSIAFPYIQAGAVYENYKRITHTTGDISENVEISGAIGSFLVWDEFGGHALTLKHGNAGLRHVTEVDPNFHSHLLRRDILTLLGKNVEPRWSQVTSAYLEALFDGLADAKNSRNVAHMIAFEHHAHGMIKSMWNSISRIFGVRQDSRLMYFYLHVGGDSPAEAFHVEMTRRMIGHLVAGRALEPFLETCLDAYAANIEWCEAILDARQCRVVPIC